ERAGSAAELLDRLGWAMSQDLRRKADVALRITLTWDGAAGIATSLSDAVKAAWQQLGIQTPQAVASWSYLRGLMRKGQFEVALARLASHQDADLYEYFHTRGSENLAGVSDAALDDALVDYRVAPTPEARRAAKEAVSERLAFLDVVTVLYAPAPVMLTSRRVRGVE